MIRVIMRIAGAPHDDVVFASAYSVLSASIQTRKGTL
jgi:hypothetical protein